MSRVPPNCRFEIDDFEQPWSYSKPFDYIHGRELEGSIRDHDRLFKQALDNLNPNGWFEISSFDVNTYSDDGTHLGATNLLLSIKHMHESSRMFGKDMTSSPSWKDRMKKAGFVNVKEDVLKVCCPFLTRMKPLTYWWIAAPKSMAQRPQAQGAWSVPSTEHAWSHAHLHICIVFKSAWVDTRRDWGTVGRNSNGAAGYIVSPVHKGAGGLRPETRGTSECLGDVNRKFISQSYPIYGSL